MPSSPPRSPGSDPTEFLSSNIQDSRLWIRRYAGNRAILLSRELLPETRSTSGRRCQRIPRLQCQRQHQGGTVQARTLALPQHDFRRKPSATTCYNLVATSVANTSFRSTPCQKQSRSSNFELSGNCTKTWTSQRIACEPARLQNSQPAELSFSLSFSFVFSFLFFFFFFVCFFFFSLALNLLSKRCFWNLLRSYFHVCFFFFSVLFFPCFCFAFLLYRQSNGLLLREVSVRVTSPTCKGFRAATLTQHGAWRLTPQPCQRSYRS